MVFLKLNFSISTGRPALPILLDMLKSNTFQTPHVYERVITFVLPVGWTLNCTKNRNSACVRKGDHSAGSTIQILHAYGRVITFILKGDRPAVKKFQTPHVYGRVITFTLG